ncbi:hypothetical protein B0H39_003446 [Clostridium beijerinckii]|uniref:hypothetical protein n=1 Tax=Clostridium beijerinckii TaxID=1520 RepID=UPI0014949195|nr:hypothetical protein [Clostridium beijerinckii]NOW85565.1 hypothetical protein [Clostridium beijerinckii]
MPRKFKCESIEGQLSLWDIGITENKGSFTKSEVNVPKTDDKITKIEEKVTKVLNNAQIVQNENPIDKLKITPEQQEFLNKNKVMENENLSRLIKQCCGYIAIEIAYEDSYVTTYINMMGIKEFDSPKKVQVLPMDKILYYKSLDFKANNTQEEKLLKIKDKALKVIRRKGDENIIIITEKNVISINSIGWVLEWNGIKVIYDEDEVEKDEILQEAQLIEEDLKVGDSVEATYGGEVIQGVVSRIYGPGNVTINIIFDGKHSAFFRGHVRKIHESA